MFSPCFRRKTKVFSDMETKAEKGERRKKKRARMLKMVEKEKSAR